MLEDDCEAGGVDEDGDEDEERRASGGRTSDGPACDALARRSAHTLAACSGTRVAITVTKLLTARAKLR